MFDETMFMRATGALVTRRAHANADVFSGNSERKGATHWMKTNWEMPNVTARLIIEARKGSATRKMAAPPARKSDPTAAHRFQPLNESAQRETRGISSSCSIISSRTGILSRTQRYAAYVDVSTAASTSERLPSAHTTTKSASGGSSPRTSTA